MKQTAATSTTIHHLLQSGARILLALLILLLPKCGLCLAVYLNMFSLMGISITRYFPYLLPVLTGLLILNLVIGYVKARKMKDYKAWGLSVAASALLLLNKTWLEIEWLSWASVAFLVIASVMQLWQSRNVCSRDLW